MTCDAVGVPMTFGIINLAYHHATSMNKILSVVGARPQFIKSAQVSRALLQAGIQEVLLHTGQHYDRAMSGVFFDELGIREPDYNLGVGSGTHATQTAAMLTGIERVLMDERPDALLIYGDTNSTLAGALAAPNSVCPSATSKRACARTIARCPKRSTVLWPIAFPPYSFAPPALPPITLNRKGYAGEFI